MGNEEKKTDTSSDSRFRASGREAIKENVAAAFEHAHQSIAVFTPILDSHYFNTPRVSDALAGMCAGGRPNRVRILVARGDETIRSNGRITRLAQRFSDFIEIRQLEDNVGTFSEMFMLVDRNGYIHQPDSEKAEALVDFQASHEVGALTRRFEKGWERSEVIPGLHVLGLGR